MREVENSIFLQNRYEAEKFTRINRCQYEGPLLYYKNDIIVFQNIPHEIYKLLNAFEPIVEALLRL